jgi:hypothetical protein
MNCRQLNKFKVSVFKAVACLLFFSSCERDVSDVAVLATYSKTAEVFTDNFVGMGNDFIKFYGGSNFQSFAIDRTQGYESTTSIRINVPNGTNTNGNYSGGIFVIDGVGRDLTGYTALTFWVKASRGVSIDQLGFGEDFEKNKFMASLVNLSVDTGWTKVIIPFPDPSKLKNERGMFRYAAGTQGTAGVGYTLWFDEIKFEKLGTFTNEQTAIQSGNSTSINTFAGVTNQVNGLRTVFNMPNVARVAVSSAPQYFNFISSNPAVATVNEQGVVTSLSAGTTIITARFNGKAVSGSLNINCFGVFPFAPKPNKPADRVISIFSNAYTNRPVNYFNGYWQPWQTTVSEDFTVTGDNVLHYTIFNFVGIDFSSPTVNATSMTHFHADFYFPAAISPNRQLRVLLVDFGANGVFGGGDDTRHSTTFVAPAIFSQNWVSIDIPFSEMSGLLSRANLGQIIFEGGDNSSLFVDNIYFYN